MVRSPLLSIQPPHLSRPLTLPALAAVLCTGTIPVALAALFLANLAPAIDSRSVLLGTLAVAAAALPGLAVARHGLRAPIARAACLLALGSAIRTIGSAALGVAILLLKKPDPAPFFLTIVAVAWGGLIAETGLLVRRFWNATPVSAGGNA